MPLRLRESCIRASDISLHDRATRLHLSRGLSCRNGTAVRSDFLQDTRRVLSLPGGVEPLLCRQGVTSPFDEADRACSDVVLFTSSDTITFQILNLSANGVIQPFTSEPKVSCDAGKRS